MRPTPDNLHTWVVKPITEHEQGICKMFGGIGCYRCCDRCNYDNHVCHFCGDPLLHDGRNINGFPHPCSDDSTH